MSKALFTSLAALVGLSSAACDDDNKKATNTGEGGAVGAHTCAAVKDTTITYVSNDACQPGFIKIEKIEKTGGPTSVPVEL